MRVAALYDIHGNLPALEAVLEDVRNAGVDQVVVGGDVCPGPMCAECLECLRGLQVATRFIRGNGDRDTLALASGGTVAGVPEIYLPAMRWGAAQLNAEARSFMAEWPATLLLEINQLGRVLFCHATPQSDTSIFTRLTAEERLMPLFEAAGADVVVCGHTHMQFDRMVGHVRVVNAGSVGMPFGAAGADWLLLGPDIQLRHTGYDLASAAARIRATASPQAEEFASRSILNPPAEADMLELFTRAELN